MPDEEIIKEEEQVEEPVVETEKPVQNRFTQLSEKVKTTAQERDEAKAAAEAANKEVEFYKGFSKVSSKYQDAAEYQDKIREKVLAGYDMEDAAISVLAKANKLPSAPISRESPAGGSATTTLKSPDDKLVSEMTQAEKREKLMEMERTEPGSLSQTLRTLNRG